MARRLLTSDDLIAKKNDNLTIWHMSLVQFRGQKRGHCFSELSDHPLRIVPEWGECISKIFKLIILGRIYSYGFDWHAIKHWTPFTHSPPFIHCYCSQYEESQITPFCCHTGPRLSSLSTLHTTSNNFTSSPFVCKERCETICSQDREGQLWSKLMWDNDIQRRAQCRTSERHCVVLEIHPGCEYLTDRGRPNQHLP